MQLTEDSIYILSPNETLYRKMTDKLAARLKNNEEYSEFFAQDKKLAKKYEGTLYMCHVNRPNKLLVLNKTGVKFTIDLILADSDKMHLTKNDLINMAIMIFRLILATGCLLYDEEYHNSIFDRLNLSEHYDILKPNQKGNPVALYDILQNKLTSSQDSRPKIPCMRNTYYEIDVPLVNRYSNFRYTLPHFLKPYGFDGVLFLSFYNEIVIFVGSDNTVTITPVIVKSNSIVKSNTILKSNTIPKSKQKPSLLYRPPRSFSAMPPQRVTK